MRTEHFDAIPSKAAIAGHPIHPMLVALPIGSLVGALVCDIVFWTTGDPFWARAAMYLVGGGLVTGVLAAIFGFTDFVTVPAIRQFTAAWVHFVGNGIAMVLTFVSLLVRVPDPVAAVVPWGIALSLMTCGTLVVTGWMGGELAFRHRVGVTPQETTTAVGEPISLTDHRQRRVG
jgi:uncharacterized membrane protein